MESAGEGRLATDGRLDFESDLASLRRFTNPERASVPQVVYVTGDVMS